MTNLTLLHVAGAAVIGGGISIGSQLIVAYLKQGKDDQKEGKEAREERELLAPKACPIISDLPVMASFCQTKRQEFTEWKSGIDMCMVKHSTNIDQHSRQLQKGNKDFEELKKDIAGINVSLAIFAEKMKKDARDSDDKSTS